MLFMLLSKSNIPILINPIKTISDAPVLPASEVTSRAVWWSRELVVSGEATSGCQALEQ